MNIEQLPLTAFALEGSGAAALAVGTVHTLTLARMQSTFHLDMPLQGTASANAPAAPGSAARFSVAASTEPVLTLTF